MTDQGVPVKVDGEQCWSVDATDMTVVAWIGPDEYDHTRGIKSAHAAAGWVPLAAKGEHEQKLRRGDLRAQLQNLANEHGCVYQLVRFRYAEVIETLEPGN